jgi:oxygen-independent coproporphyrinogen-3 oxidase
MKQLSLMAATSNDTLGLYISIPFCRSKCTYCNFASGVFPAKDHERYVARVIEDLRAAPAWAAKMAVHLPRRVDSVYFGGGTPSLLSPDLIRQLFAAMHAEFGFDPAAEINVECAPGQIADDTLQALVQCGVQRVSLGVQSFIDREAQVSGRLHSRAIVMDDLRRLRAAGITNINLDLIAGLAGQTAASWDESLNVLIDAATPHASVYMLEVDEDSRLGREMISGGSRYFSAQVPTDDAIADMYQHAIARLASAGLRQYEISNFSRPRHQSRHNLRYWQRRPYLGLGLDASSMLYAVADDDHTRTGLMDGLVSGHDFSRAAKGPKIAGLQPLRDVLPLHKRIRETASTPPYILRTSAIDDLSAFLAGPAPVETAWLSPARQLEEAWFLGLRMNAGVNLASLRREFGHDPVSQAMPTITRLVDEGLLTSDAKTVRLTAQGRLLSNDVFQQFLGLDSTVDSDRESEDREAALAAR